ncbi:uncharacterized protein LOC142322594 [Lycorma delicatula]|uniref:uncharacterized protein LOC142322594 n=1 Tax=Lycorma delicatula TaxID=130591 RepID=UPI003F51205B
MKIQYINANRSGLVHDLLWESSSAGGIDYVLITEPNRSRVTAEHWWTDLREDVAIRDLSSRFAHTDLKSGEGYVRIKGGGWLLYCCYISPNCIWEDYIEFLDGLGEDVRRCNCPVIIFGDFNAKITEVGGEVTNRRGVALAEMTASLRLISLNDGTPTFWRGYRGSVIDHVYVSDSMMMPTEFEVLGDELCSDHRGLRVALEGLRPLERPLV